MNFLINGWYDLKKTFQLKHIWFNLAISETKSSYKKTKLGPFWITLSTLVMISAMGPLYSKLFNTELNEYFIYLACGFIFWDFTKGVILDTSRCYIDSAEIVMSNNFPRSIFIFKSIFKNIINLTHNLIIIFFTIIIFGKNFGIIQLTFIVGLILSILNLASFLCVISIFCTRFRDLIQIINNLMTVMFFLTPIIWHQDILKDKIVFVYGNPFFLIIDSIRSPLMYNVFPFVTNFVLLLIFLIFLPINLYIFGKYKNKISLWL